MSGRIPSISKSTSWFFSARPWGMSIPSDSKQAWTSSFFKKIPCSKALRKMGDKWIDVLRKQTPCRDVMGGTRSDSTNRHSLSAPLLSLKNTWIGIDLLPCTSTSRSTWRWNLIKGQMCRIKTHTNCTLEANLIRYTLVQVPSKADEAVYYKHV